MSPEERSGSKQEIAELLVSGRLEEAAAWYRQHNFSTVRVEETATDAYRVLMKSRQYSTALDVCKMFNLPAELKLRSISDQFHAFKEHKEFEKAYEWGARYQMSQNDLNNVAAKMFFDALAKKEVEKALACFDQYSIPSDMIINEVRQSFNNLFEAQRFVQAFIIGKRFDLSSKRTLAAGLQGYIQLFAQHNMQKFLTLEKEHHILADVEIDNVEEKIKNQFIQHFDKEVIAQVLEKSGPDALYKIITSLLIIQNYGQFDLVTELMMRVMKATAEAHNQIMSEGRGPAAFSVVQNFLLLSTDAPFELKTDIIKSAEAAHHKLLEENNLNGALFLKEKYDLFGKNRLDDSIDKLNRVLKEYINDSLKKRDVISAKKAIDQYDIHDDALKTIMTKTVDQLLLDEQYATIFEIIKSLGIKIDNPDTIAEATTRFHHNYEDNNMKTASDLAYYFKISDPRVQKAAFKYWFELMEQGKYEEAIAFKKDRKLSKKLLHPALKNIYQNMVKDSRTEEAKRLRQEYRVAVSFWVWVLEAVKRLVVSK